MTSTPLVLFPDVEQTLAEFLRDALTAHPVADDVVVGTRFPTAEHLVAAGVYVLIRRAGGASARIAVEVARIDVQVWHRSDVDAHDLAQIVRGLIQQARGVGGIRGVRESAGPVPVPDPDSGEHRYLMTVDLTVKGATP